MKKRMIYTWRDVHLSHARMLPRKLFLSLIFRDFKKTLNIVVLMISINKFKEKYKCNELQKMNHIF